MALAKRVYVDGETIITAQNLNDIQDEIISHGNTLVPKTRTVNGKALSSNVSLIATDIGYGNSTVGATLDSLNTAINSKIGNLATIVTSADQFRYVSFEFVTSGDVVLNSGIDGAIIPDLSTGIFITQGNANGVIIGSTTGGALFAFRRVPSGWGAINLQLLTSALGLTETTFVASQTIQAGKILFAKGYPFLAITDIAATTPLSTQTNVQALPDGAINYLKALIDTETSNGTDTAITTNNSNFTISTGSKYTVRGHIVEVNCILSATATTGSQAICTLPTPRIHTTIYPPAWQMFGDSVGFASSLFQNGTLYIRGTQAGTYGIHFTYFI